jgi:SAM-dependent methyltransferase
VSTQAKQGEWAWQWEQVFDENTWLFPEWIAPNRLADFRDKDVLDCGCGAGQHLHQVAPLCRTVTGIDLNAAEIARRNTAQHANVTVIEGDIATIDLGRTFDVVYSVGVLHHADDPTRAFRNITRHCRPGGRVIVWVYSREGNFWNRTVVEWVRRLCLRCLPRRAVWWLSYLLAACVSVPVYTVYRLPLRFLPFWEYFQNWRRLPFHRNALNVFDKLNAPQTQFISRAQVEAWFSVAEFTDVHVSSYVGVSWRASGTWKRPFDSAALCK